MRHAQKDEAFSVIDEALMELSPSVFISIDNCLVLVSMDGAPMVK